MHIEREQREIFIETVWNYYRQAGRHDLPWRLIGADGSIDPYRVMVSELMLQQTQVGRVIPKYQEFLTTFPSIGRLAKAELASVLTVWQGLGYNRRAKFLWESAKILDILNYFPHDREGLIKLPGIGPNTAGAVQAYAFNQPAVFIETNIRSVFIHHFFAGQDQVADRELQKLVAETLDAEHPREWYWALMDYGTHLKAVSGNAARSSKHYVKQSKFQGSFRQVRGRVLRELAHASANEQKLAREINDVRLVAVLAALEREGLISRDGPRYRLG